MAEHKSYNTENKKLQKTWDDTEENLEDAEELITQQVIDFSKTQRNQEVLDFIILQDSSFSDEFPDRTIYFSSTIDFKFVNLSDSVISSIYIVEFIDSVSEINEIENSFQFVELKEHFIKQVEEENEIICQVILPFVGIFSSILSFREVKVYINNPNQISSIQKTIQ